MKKIGGEFISSLFARARGKNSQRRCLLLEARTTRTRTRRDDIGDGGDDRLRRPLPEEDAAEEETLPIPIFPMMSKDDSDDDDEVDRCLRTETSGSDEEGTTEDEGSNILLAEEDEAEAEVILAAGRGRLRIIIAREKAEVVTTSFESEGVVLPAGRTTDADGTIDEKNTTNLLWINERENNILHLYNTRFEKVSCDRFNRTDCSCV